MANEPRNVDDEVLSTLIDSVRVALDGDLAEAYSDALNIVRSEGASNGVAFQAMTFVAALALSQVVRGSTMTHETYEELKGVLTSNMLKYLDSLRGSQPATSAGGPLEMKGGLYHSPSDSPTTAATKSLMLDTGILALYDGWRRKYVKEHGAKDVIDATINATLSFLVSCVVSYGKEDFRQEMFKSIVDQMGRMGRAALGGTMEPAFAATVSYDASGNAEVSSVDKDFIPGIDSKKVIH